MTSAVLFALFLAAPQQTPSAPAAPTLAHAETLAGKGQMDKALAELDALATASPEPAGVERLRGFIFYRENKFAEAQAAYAKALAQDPKDVDSMQMQGVTYFRMGKPAEAIPLLEKAHASVPSANVDPNYVLGLCYMDTRRYDDARHAFAAQYGFAPDSAPAYLLAARLFLRREYLPASEESARKALALEPRLPLAHQLLGEVALAKADFPGAIAELEKEREINPLDGALYDRLGDAYIRNGQYDDARAALNRAVLLEPNSTGPYILLGKVLLKQQNATMAAMYLQRALHMDPSNYITHTLLGQAYRAAGRNAEAAQEFQTAEKIQAETSH